MFSRPSLTAIGSAIFLAYMANSLWSIASLYLPPTCEKNCLKNGLLHTSDFEQGNLLKGIEKKTGRREDIEPIQFSVTHFL
jgi:hypothetical protein